jgi:GNAT superfamily N-acetyltransferase
MTADATTNEQADARHQTAVACPVERSVRPRPAAGALAFVEALSRKHYEEIGFLPKPRLEQYYQDGQLWMQTENGEPCGFLVWGNGWPVLRVYQVCIQYDAQRRLHGAELVGRLIRKAEAEGYERISAWVADDIPANDFWNAMGFRLHGQRAGGSKRGRMHNAWVYWCAAPRQLVLLGPNAELTGGASRRPG